MFLENDYARPLFDTVNGGPPKAFECRLCSCGGSFLISCTLATDHTKCTKVTRTERGMKMHLKLVHGIEEQTCLFLTGTPTDLKSAAGNPRKLRLFTKENIAATTKRSLIQDMATAAGQPTGQLPLTEPKTNEPNLPEPTSPEK